MIGTPFAWARMMSKIATLPISSEPPATAAKIAAPPFMYVYSTSTPYLWKTPARMPYSAPMMSCEAVPARRICGKACAPRTLGTLTEAAAAARKADLFKWPFFLNWIDQRVWNQLGIKDGDFFLEPEIAAVRGDPIVIASGAEDLR